MKGQQLQRTAFTTLQDVLKVDWNPMRDYPNILAPHRASIIASAVVANEYDVRFDVQVIANRKGTRWWLYVLFKEHPTIKLYVTTASKAVRDGWLKVVRQGDNL